MNDAKYLHLLYEIASHDISYISKIHSQQQRKPAKRKYSWCSRIFHSFVNPFSILLLTIAIISLSLDLFHITNEHQYTTIPILITLFIGGIVRFIQEQRSLSSFEKLIDRNHTSITVQRNHQEITVPVTEIEIGDIVSLHKGDYVPGDLRIISCDHLYVSQAVLTGESQPVKKNQELILEKRPYFQYSNIVYMGSQIISGELKGIIFADQNQSIYGKYIDHLKYVRKNYHYGFYDITFVFLKFIAVLIPLVFLFSIFDTNIIMALLFSLSIVIGLIPEMLPMIINLCFVAGSHLMEQKQSIVKNINAMEKLGSMDVLCVDKTGTLTQDKIILEYYVDILGNESGKTMLFGLLNSCFLEHKNHIDEAILRYQQLDHFQQQLYKYKLLDTLPFDYSRKYASVLVSGQQQVMIVKGSVDEVFARCRYVEYNDKIIEIDSQDHSGIHTVIDEMSEDGMKILAVAYKKYEGTQIFLNDECDLILLGYLVFFDSPKTSAKNALKQLENLSIQNKVLTGDHLDTTLSVCKRLGMDTSHYLTGSQLCEIDENELPFVIEKTHIFAQLTPSQKAEIIQILKFNGHTVGFLGDGMNDLSAVLEADVGISVENAMDITKKVSDVILLKKDLHIVGNGVIEGRKSFANMIKYVKITASSNFGNIFSIALASAFLPFVPMTATQILLLNIFYDLLCVIIPFDSVDDDVLQKPQFFLKQNLSSFLIHFGLMSSLFDIITFLFLFFVLCPFMCHGYYASLNLEMKKYFVLLFQSGWFLESLWSQVCILWMLRTAKKPFVESKPSQIMLCGSMLGIILLTIMMFTPLAQLLTLTILPLWYLLFMIFIVFIYMILASCLKSYYLKKYKNWL